MYKLSHSLGIRFEVFIISIKVFKLVPLADFAPPALCMLSFSIVPSYSVPPNSCATMSKFKVIVAQ
ncbi:hypothetical protein SIK57_19545 [Clostridioides difficile]|nr:hypothetical protein [Clostridioides difficile]MDX5764150.1 hypothetical protein [Clostridioides difficile]